MADEQKPKAEKRIENLELNKETVTDLTEPESEGAEGGARAAPDQISKISLVCVSCGCWG